MNKNITFAAWLKSKIKSFIERNEEGISIIVYMLVVGITFESILYFFGFLVAIIANICSLCAFSIYWLYSSYLQEVKHEHK